MRVQMYPACAASYGGKCLEHAANDNCWEASELTRVVDYLVSLHQAERDQVGDGPADQGEALNDEASQTGRMADNPVLLAWPIIPRRVPS